MLSTIYEYVLSEEKRFESDKVRIGDNWEWNFRDHVQLIFHLRNSVFYTGDNDFTTSMRAFKNIIEPILELCSWTEDIELKDIVFYVENDRHRVLSFLIKKYYDEVFVKQHDMDSFIDDLIDSDLEYGGVLVQKTGSPRPEVKELNTIAFCDQTDIMGSPLGFKMYFSPDTLRAMEEYGWGDPANGATTTIQDLCVLATEEKSAASLPDSKTNKVPGKQIEVFIVQGNMPESYLKADGDAEYYCNQVQVIAYYHDKDKNKIGVTLYRKKEVESRLKFFTSKKVYGRALGRGIAERLLHPQIWTNFLAIHKTQMLQSAAKTPLYTDDENYTQRNKIQDMENLEVTTVQEGRRIFQVPTAATANIQLYEKSIDEWYQHAQLQGAAFDPILGEEQASGTTFRGQERTVAQGRGPHNKRRGKRAKFIEEVYRDWIIPYIVKEITKGTKFLATLTADEVQWVSDRLADNHAFRKQIDMVVAGKIPPEADKLRNEFLKEFSKSGSTQMIEIMKEDFKDAQVNIGINVAGKQKDLANLSDKVLSIFQYVFTNPQGFQQAMQIPALSKAFQDILEFSGLNPSNFATLVQATTAAPVMPQPQQGTPSPISLNNAPAEV